MRRKVTAGIILTLLSISILTSTFKAQLPETQAIPSKTGAMAAMSPPPTYWNKTYGGANDDYAKSVVQTKDGGYAIAGYTSSFGAGGYDFWLVKTDSAGGMLWNKTYGGAGDDDAYSVVQTADGGYALAGQTYSFGAGGADFWLVRTDSAGSMLWNKTFGGAGDDIAFSMVQTADGGYALAGQTYSFGAGGADFWLVRTDSAGSMLWNKTYGGADYDLAHSVVQTADGGYALAGWTYSFGAGLYDFWLVRTDSAGGMLWNKTYGGAYPDLASSVVQTADGGYALAGTTNSFGAGLYDFWLVRTDSAGGMLWNKTYGGAGDDFVYSVVQTADGGYALAGYTSSSGAGGYDFWLVKTDSAGNMLWNKTYGGAGSDIAFSMVQTADGGYALAGWTSSFGAGGYDFWLVKLSPSTIYIRADGSVDPPTAPIQRNGEVYTLTDDVNTTSDGIVIQRNSIVLDGQGHFLQGVVGTTGINLSGRFNVTVQNVSIRQFDVGILLFNCTRDLAVGNSVDHARNGSIVLDYASYNTLAGNNLTANYAGGILLYYSPTNTIITNRIIDSYTGCRIGFSSGNSISENTIMTSNDTAIFIGFSSGNVLTGNNITNNFQGIRFSSCSGNQVYHNNFVNNWNRQVSMSESTASWDEGYPSGGNYWSDYNGTDVYRGPSQNLLGSDGIGDVPYVINGDNQDNYPLMRPWTGSHSTQYPWPMFHHDPTHAGYTESSGPNTNQTLWSYTAGSFVDSSPAVADGRVYVGSVDGRVYCLDSLTGTQVWNYTTGREVYSSPAVVDGRVYVGSYDNKTYCLDASTGVQLWNYTTGKFVDSSPAVSGGVVFVGSDDYKVYALNATTGALIWNYTTGSYVSSSPAVADGVVFVGSLDGKVYALNAATGVPVWHYTTGGAVWSSPAVAGGVVFVGSGDGKVYALNAATGALIWSYTTGSYVDSSPAVSGGVVFVGSYDYKVYALNATTGAQVWNYTTGSSVHSSPAVADGVVFVGSYDGKVYALNAATGALVWSYATGNKVYSSPAVSDGRVFVGSEDGHLYAFGRVISFPKDFKTLQKAIDAASPGDTILVAPGVYHDQGVVVNKTITIIGEEGSGPVFDGGGSGQIFMSLNPGASGSVIAGLMITNYGQGIIVNASNCKIYNTQMSLMSQNGIALMGAGNVNNQIYGNIFQNNQIAVNVTAYSAGNVVHDNIVSTNANVGINLESGGNIVCTNTISGNHLGIRVASSGNTLFHNNVVGNVVQTGVVAGAVNSWDDGYPSGGSYWSDYTGVDHESGPGQNITGSDGIGDTQYVVFDVNNVDRYPLMQPLNPHNLGVTSAIASKTVVGQGLCLSIEAGILNYGVFDEKFAVDALANTTTVATQTVTLTKGDSVTIAFTWNTTGFAKGNYSISAHAWPVPGETDTADNIFTGGWVFVSMVGDLTGGTHNVWDFVPDGKVSGADVSVVARCFGSSPQTLPPLRWEPNCDLNNNGHVDGSDVATVARHFGESNP